MYDPKTLREEIIRPTLSFLCGATGRFMGGKSAEDLLVMIAAHESHLGKYRRQVGGGPARGIYQIEIPTHEDLFDNYLRYREEYLDAVAQFFDGDNDPTWSLEHCDAYATAVARFLLWRVPEPIPKIEDFTQSSDPLGAYYWNLAKYAKTYWNTPEGAATPEKYLEDFLRLT